VKKYWLIVLLSSAIILVCVAFMFFMDSMGRIDENAETDQMGSGQVITHGSRDKKQVALTFDACMTYGMDKSLRSGQVKSYYNQPVIDELTKEKVPATLFLSGLWAKDYPEVTKSLAKNPFFEIGNHSYSHPAFTLGCFGLPYLSSSDKENEIKLSQDILFKLTGKEPKLFRFPGGCYGEGDLKLAKNYGLDVVGWDLASGDAFNDNAESIIKRVESRVQPGSIIVMHMIGDVNAPVTAKALPEIISYLRANGYTFIKVSDLLK
jgi:peptidoglycan/xylan/chitin deacetylase (PgdA/CDA1 family)